MPQRSRAVGTDATGNWATTVGLSLYEDVDEETANDDTDYIVNIDAGTAILDMYDLKDPASSSDHIIRTRYRYEAGAADFNLTVNLRVGTTSIASRTIIVDTDTPGWVTDEWTLTAVQADNITDYTNLKIRLTVTFTADQVVNVTWVEIQVPNWSPVVPGNAAMSYHVARKAWKRKIRLLKT